MEKKRIELILDAWQTEHFIRALVIDGRSFVLGVLQDWSETEKAEWTTISHSIKRVAGADRIRDHQCVRLDNYGSDEKAKKGDHHNPRIHELRSHTKHARILFFYEPDEDETIIFTNTYWKTGSDEKGQGAAFARARKLRNAYLRSIGRDPDKKTKRKRSRRTSGRRRRGSRRKR